MIYFNLQDNNLESFLFPRSRIFSMRFHRNIKPLKIHYGADLVKRFVVLNRPVCRRQKTPLGRGDICDDKKGKPLDPPTGGLRGKPRKTASRPRGYKIKAVIQNTNSGFFYLVDTKTLTLYIRNNPGVL